MDQPPSRPLPAAAEPGAEHARPERLPGQRPWDGRARDPAELLDNLRLRLADLAANHPSHPASPADERAGRSWPAGGRGGPEPPGTRERAPAAGGPDCKADQAGTGQRTGDGAAAADGPGGGRERAEDAAQASGGRRDLTGGAARAARLAADRRAGPADLLGGPGGWPGPAADAAGALDALGSLGWAARPGHADPYRPWFMTGEPASPWWAAGGGPRP